LDIVDRKVRDILEINDPEKRAMIFSKYLDKSVMICKETKTEVKIKEASADGQKIIIENLDFNIPFPKGKIYTLSKILGRYIEIECEVAGEKPNGIILLRVKKVKVSHKDRMNDRITPSSEAVWVTNIRANGVTIDTNFITVPTFIKINFDDYQNKLRNNFDYIKIDIFKPDLEARFDIVKQSAKTLYIENTQDKKSYDTNSDEDFLNVNDEFFGETNKMMTMYKLKGITSEIIMPVIYVSPFNEAVPFGYVHIQSKGKLIDADQVMDVKILTFEMIDRIRESNFILNTGKYQIIDMSPGGMKIRVPDAELKNTLPHISSFNCDIFFKMQSAVNVKCQIRFLGKADNGDLILGLQFMGYREGDKDKYVKSFELLKGGKQKFRTL
jgi:hypothetical protein